MRNINKIEGTKSVTISNWRRTGGIVVSGTVLLRSTRLGCLIFTLKPTHNVWRFLGYNVYIDP